MHFYTAKTPGEYQELFYRQIGLERIQKGEQEIVWENAEHGFVHNYGTMDQIQSGVGCYTVPYDFLVEYQYDVVYLHFGIIYEGITYSLIENKLEPRSIPSAFLAVEKTSGGINCWKMGQHFKGVEVSIEMNYLKEVLLPFLGVMEDAVGFLEENVRYIHLPEEMKYQILRMEELIQNNRMTMPLQRAICLEFTALLLHPENRAVFSSGEKTFLKYVQIGNRRIKITRDDFRKIVMAHERIQKDASSFVTIYELSRELQISEQKLKAGFKEIYQQTLWDYANHVRMNAAVNLLLETELSVSQIAKNIGYQSQVAFINMFKKWCGLTPGQFRVQLL